MNSAFLLSPGVLEINRKTPMPVAGPGEVVIKVRAALTCGTDIKAFLRGHPKIPMPSPMGHEFAGDIVEAGEGVSGFKVGDAVMGVHTAPCGKCRYCGIGHENLCEKIMDEKVLGAYAEYLKLPAHVVSRNLFHKPGHLSYQEAAMLEPLACVVHGLRVAVRDDVKNVLILGAGPIGLFHLLLNKMAGRKVIVAGRRAEKMAKARELGADLVVDTKLEDLPWAITEATDGLGADLVIEATGSKEIWEASPRFVRKGGTVLLFGGCPSGTKACFDAGHLHYDEITIMGAFHFTPAAVREAYELLISGKVDTKPLISGEFALKDIHTAFEELIAGRGIKYAIIP
jgi:L-iditol 2-dehydrogenase